MSVRLDTKALLVGLIGVAGFATANARADQLEMAATCFGLEKFVPPSIAGIPMEKEVSCGTFTSGPKTEWGKGMAVVGGPSSQVKLTISTKLLPVAEWGDLSQNAKAEVQNAQTIATLKQAAGADPQAIAPMIETLENTRYFTIARQYDSMLLWDKGTGHAALSIFISSTILVQTEYPAANPDEAMTLAKKLYQDGNMGGLASFEPR